MDFRDQDEIFAVFGEFDKNLREIEEDYGVSVYARGNSVTISGERNSVEDSAKRLMDIRKGVSPAVENNGSGYIRTPTGKEIKPMSPKQSEYISAMEEKDIVVAIGPAGTGKTFLACVQAVKCLKKGIVDRVVLTRPVVEAGEKLGFLPGDLHEKVNPYLRPLYDAFYTLIGPAKFQKYRADEVIEIVPLAYMRGRTLDDSMIILDEAQNTSSGQMKMFLTRLGFNSKVVITGDITQVDLDQHKVSGLIEIQDVLRNIEDVGFIYFTKADVVRHRLVKKIIDAYNRFKKDT
ncbi:MAG: PhoH family protein [Elusimicrobia bacterium]|nr:PhoH family protein [Elusimicrobiota bacterium]